MSQITTPSIDDKLNASLVLQIATLFYAYEAYIIGAAILSTLCWFIFYRDLRLFCKAWKRMGFKCNLIFSNPLAWL